jgi:hypothetical protein
MRRIKKKRLSVQGKPNLTVAQILAWADEHYQRTGTWPMLTSGPVRSCPEVTWKGVNSALSQGFRGLPGGTTLPKLLAAARGVRNVQDLPPLTVKQILAWADDHHQRTGTWPRHQQGGEIVGSQGETWHAINHSLMNGRRGLPGGLTLADLLAQHRGVRNVGNLPPLTVKQILAWADEHHARTGRWPAVKTPGTIPGTLGETWRAVDTALERGIRGLPGGSLLAKLLLEHRGVRNPHVMPPLTLEQIIAWADDHYRRRKTWPSRHAGLIRKTGGETWRGVDDALRLGYRGLPGRSSLSAVLKKHRAIAEEAIRLLG